MCFKEIKPLRWHASQIGSDDSATRSLKQKKEAVMLRKLVAAIIGVSALVPSTMFGLGMGEVELDSYLNQPLDARIELLQTRGLSSSEIIANLASVSDFSAAGVDRSFFLSQLKFEIVQGSDGKSYLKVSSDRPVTEPYLNFLIEVQWPAGRLLREYTLLLDPPEFKDELPLAVRAAETRKTQSLSSQSDTGVTPAAETIPAERPKVEVSYGEEEPAAQPEPSVSTPVASTKPTTQASKPAEPAAPASSAVSGSTVQTYKVKSSDTLSDIVRKTQSNSAIPMPQALIAYQYLNPDAFIDDNINLIKKGAVLRIPSESEIRNLSRAEAVKEIAAQNKAWRAKVMARQQMADDTELSGRQLDGTGRDLTPDQTPPKTDEGRLSILTPGSNEANAEKAASGQGGSNTNNAAAVSKLQDQLSLQQEEVEKFNVANESLTGEIADVKNLLEKTDRVISLKDDQIASLQAQLKLLREQEAEALGQAETPDAEMPMLNEEPEAAETAQGESPFQDMQNGVQTEEPEVAETEDATAQESEVPEETPAFDEAIAEQKPESASSMLTNPLYLGGAGALLLAILGLLWMRSRQDDEDEEDEDDDYEYTASLDDEDEDDDEDFDVEKAATQDFTTEKLDRQLLEAENDFDIDTVLSEADIYVAYGHFPKAIAMLQDGLKESPESPALNLKLMEVHAESKDVDAFQEVETHVRGFTSDDAVLSKINAMRQDLGLAAGAGPAPAEEESFSEEETQFIGEATSTENLTSVDEDEDFLSLADIEAELDVGGFGETKPKTEESAAPKSSAFEEEMTTDSLFAAEETQVNDVEGFDEELDLSGGALDFNFEETSVPEDSPTTAESFSPDDALADIDQEIGNFDEDIAALDALVEDEPEKKESLQGNDLSGDFGDLDLDALDNLDKTLDSLDPASKEDFSLDITPDVTPEAEESALEEVALDETFDTNEAVELPAEEELDLDAGFSLDDEAVTTSEFDGSEGLSSEDASLLDGVDEVGTKLDLATAYIDMGDHEGAKDILDEVLLEGTEDQQQLARELLEKVG